MGTMDDVPLDSIKDVAHDPVVLRPADLPAERVNTILWLYRWLYNQVPSGATDQCCVATASSTLPGC